MFDDRLVRRRLVGGDQVEHLLVELNDELGDGVGDGLQNDDLLRLAAVVLGPDDALGHQFQVVRGHFDRQENEDAEQVERVVDRGSGERKPKLFLIGLKMASKR